MYNYKPMALSTVEHARKAAKARWKNATKKQKSDNARRAVNARWKQWREMRAAEAAAQPATEALVLMAQ
jgi:hypothetical protein